ncbi:preprotein translocase subunit SecG [Caloramator mitchellensis]|uniref:Protein-export membrane protein SecG n=1 Tax=Caloramator mitchellensis TaxID=908809 RepID=A0A0R3JWW2_CALMK|nr:preprotein translocase subunit SecG [Caloramator mitchellensis]KRQ88041.1 preprotein translocase subunit SecG [Caloramator mitchellensis]
MKTVITIIHVIVSLSIIAVVLGQPAKTYGLSSAISGGAETFFGKHKGRTIEGKLKKLTAFAMGLFVLTSLLLVYYTGK